MDWQRTLGRLILEVEHRVDRVRRGLNRRFRPGREGRVVTYRSYGTPESIRLRGRVLYGRVPPPSSPGDAWWVNLSNAFRRLFSTEVSHARLRVSYEGTVQEVEASEEGHFEATLATGSTRRASSLWHEARVELVRPGGEGATAMVAVPSSARFGIISDLDDTVVHMGATSLIRMAREVLFGNVHTRMPFPGVSAFYQALHTGRDGGLNPIFYVSSSPWNLYDVLSEFLHLHGIPAGPMELRDWGVTSEEVLPAGHRAHKRAAIDRILATYPDLPFILVGDSGQQDPEIYREVVHHNPGRVLGIYIRSVVRTPARLQAIRELTEELASGGSTELILVNDTLEAAAHAAERGWIDSAALPGVARTRDHES